MELHSLSSYFAKIENSIPQVVPKGQRKSYQISRIFVKRLWKIFRTVVESGQRPVLPAVFRGSPENIREEKARRGALFYVRSAYRNLQENR